MKLREKELMNKIRQIKKIYSTIEKLLDETGKPDRFVVQTGGIEYDITEDINNGLFTSSNVMELIRDEGIKSTNNRDLKEANIDKTINLVKRYVELSYKPEAEDTKFLRFDTKAYAFTQCMKTLWGVDEGKIYTTYIINRIENMALKQDTSLSYLSFHMIMAFVVMYFPIKAGLFSSFRELEGLSFQDLPENMTELTWEQYIDWLNKENYNGDAVDLYLKAFSAGATREAKLAFLSELNEEARGVNKTMHEGADWNAKDIVNKLPYADDVKHLSVNITDITDYVAYLTTVDLGSTTFKFDTTRAFVEWLALGENENGIQIIELTKPLIGYIPGLFKLLCGSTNLFRADLEFNKQEFNKAAEQAKKNKEAYREMRSQLKKVKTEMDELKQKLNAQVSKNSKQAAFIQKLKEQGVSDTAPLKEEIERQRKESEAYKIEIENLRRQLSKATKQIASLGEQNKRLTSNNVVLENKNKAIQGKANNIAETVSGNSIPVDCYIRAIRNRKITIYGGDMIHSELRKLGFRNLKLFEADNRNVSTLDLSHQDLIVMVTGYIAHSTSHIPKLASEKYGIPLLYFNNKNINILIQEMFKVFYSERYERFKRERSQSGY